MTQTVVTREDVRRLVDILPEQDLPTVNHILKGLLALRESDDVPFTDEEAEEFAYLQAASYHTWNLIEKDSNHE